MLLNQRDDCTSVDLNCTCAGCDAFQAGGCLSAADAEQNGDTALVPLLYQLRVWHIITRDQLALAVGGEKSVAEVRKMLPRDLVDTVIDEASVVAHGHSAGCLCLGKCHRRDRQPS